MLFSPLLTDEEIVKALVAAKNIAIELLLGIFNFIIEFILYTFIKNFLLMYKMIH
tara:strand:+ start:204 stop:368 length:165 start_codon:yes stop_codon:yes gene_type:complete